MTEGWIMASRSGEESGGTIAVLAGPPGISTLTVTPVPSRSPAQIAVLASSAALDGP